MDNNTRSANTNDNLRQDNTKSAKQVDSTRDSGKMKFESNEKSKMDNKMDNCR